MSSLKRYVAAAYSAVFIVCYTLISFGYFLGLSKLILIPRKATLFGIYGEFC